VWDSLASTQKNPAIIDAFYQARVRFAATLVGRSAISLSKRGFMQNLGGKRLSKRPQCNSLDDLHGLSV
jgi:hypothetical protein